MAEYETAMVDGKPFVLPPRWRQERQFRRCSFCDDQAAFVILQDWRYQAYLHLCPKHQTALDRGENHG